MVWRCGQSPTRPDDSIVWKMRRRGSLIVINKRIKRRPPCPLTLVYLAKLLPTERRESAERVDRLDKVRRPLDKTPPTRCGSKRTQTRMVIPYPSDLINPAKRLRKPKHDATGCYAGERS